ncbi:hypothetical protein DZC73_29415 [Albitalea terrae]|uniref:Uncharacterized protein n=1 Tax=Piscinibacter terrae TaxID=2496871 RepID=A0A3N7JQ20_9BURK|nr:hypothetical protein DZC73_29415 [Albitalea terrae]
MLSSVFVLIALNVVPGVHIDLPWQLVGVLVACVANLLVWQRSKVPPMPLREAGKLVVQGFLVILVLAAIDTILGFAFGQHTVVGAFVHSGAFGGVADAFLFFGGLFIGVPTLARAVYLHCYAAGA